MYLRGTLGKKPHKKTTLPYLAIKLFEFLCHPDILGEVSLHSCVYDTLANRQPVQVLFQSLYRALHTDGFTCEGEVSIDRNKPSTHFFKQTQQGDDNGM